MFLNKLLEEQNVSKYLSRIFALKIFTKICH